MLPRKTQTGTRSFGVLMIFSACCTCSLVVIVVSTVLKYACQSKQQLSLKPIHCSDVKREPAYQNILTIQHCQHSPLLGVFIITHHVDASTIPLDENAEKYLPSQVLNECTGLQIYRVRVTGNEIFDATVRKQDAAVHAEYELRTHGAFHAEIMQLYSNFTFCDLTGLNDSPLVATHQWQVESDSEQSYCKSGGCSTCPLGDLHGRWIADTSSPFVTGLLDQIQHTHIFQESPEMGSEANDTRFNVVDSKLLRWQPNLPCTIEPTPDVVKAWSLKCSASNGLVCFAGDSQMRHIYAMAVSIMASNFSTVTPTGIGQPLKLIPESNWSRYHGLRFGDRAEIANFRNCTRLILNIGQWPLSYSAGPRPWTAMHYYQRVEETIRIIHRAAPQLVGNIAWMSTQPHGLVRSRHGSSSVDPTDWRTDPYIRQQNALMRHFANIQVPRLEYVDTFQIIHPLMDLSYDSPHYIGTPGFWAAALVLHTMCR